MSEFDNCLAKETQGKDWWKKQIYGPMGSFSGAEVCELIGFFMLIKVPSPKNSTRNLSSRHKTLDYIETTTKA